MPLEIDKLWPYRGLNRRQERSEGGTRGFGSLLPLRENFEENSRSVAAVWAEHWGEGGLFRPVI